LIKKNSKYNRVHTIGIGSGASQYLVIECANTGGGKSVFVNDDEDVTGTIIGLLDQALTPNLD